MKRNGFLILILLMTLISSGCGRLNNQKTVKYGAVVQASTTLNNWQKVFKKKFEKETIVTKKIKHHLAQKSSLITSSYKKIHLSKVDIPKVAKLDFNKLQIDRVTRSSSAARRRRSVIKPLVLELKSYDEKSVEFEKPIKKKVFDFKDKKIKAERKKEKKKKRRVRRDGEIQEIASNEIVKVKPVEIEIENSFKVAALLDTVQVDGSKKIALFLEEQAKKEELRQQEDQVKVQLAAEIKLDDTDSVTVDLTTQDGLAAKEIKSEQNESEKTVVVAQEELSPLTNKFQGAISSAVKQVIDREMQKPVENRQIYAAAELEEENDPLQHVNTHKQEDDREDFVASDPCEGHVKELFSRVDLFGYSGGDLGRPQATITNFEFVPSHGEFDEENRKNDSNGVVTFCKEPNDGYSLMAGTIIKDGFMDSSILLNFDEGFQQMNVPMIERERFAKFVTEYSLDEQMSAILVEKYDGIVDVRLDSYDAIKLELNDQLEVIEEKSDKAAFILFLNVEPRNILVTYTYEKSLNKFAEVEKFLFAPSRKVVFDDPMLRKNRESKHDTLTLTQRNIAGIVGSELDIEGKDLKYFITEEVSSKVGLNRFEIKIPRTLKKMRNYLLLSHLGKAVYQGYGENVNLEVPGDEFINYTLDKLGVNQNMRQQCVVQVNLPQNKVISESMVDGHNANGALYLKKYYFDNNGLYYEDEWSDKTTKIFIASELTQLNRKSVATGSISIKLKYTDGTSDYLETFCSDETYLVEQL